MRVASHAKVDRRQAAYGRFCAAYPRVGVLNLRSVAVRGRNPSTSRRPRIGDGIAPTSGVRPPRRFVYILRNAGQPPRYYTGLTAGLGARLLAHNDGRCRYTATGTP